MKHTNFSSSTSANSPVYRWSRNAKKLVVCAVTAGLIVSGASLVGCSGAAATGTETTQAQTQAQTTAQSEETTDPTPSDESATKDASDRTTIVSDASVMDDYDWTFSTRDSDPSYDAATAIKVVLSDSGSTVDGAGAAVEGSTVKITEEGTYIVSGTLSDGSIQVDLADENAKVQIVLANANITCSNGAAILVENADKVFITLADGSKNVLADTTTHDTAEDGNDHDGVIFSHDDITFNGTGSLSITANYQNGIVGKNDVRFTGGTYTISAAHHGIQGKDCIKILDGSFTVEAAQDGFHASNDEDDMLGYIGIGGGTFTVAVDDDAFHADAALLIADGMIDVSQCYEGFEGRTVSITGGQSSIIASDDAVNAATGSDATDDFAGSATMGPNGSEAMPQGDMGGQMPQDGGPGGQGQTMVDAAADESAATLQAAYEAGTTSTAIADTTADQTTTQAAVASSDVFLEITGGTLYVRGSGDALDSNGDLRISGGQIIAECAATGGDGALDYDGTGSITGGTFAAIGPTDMAQGFGSASTQASILLNAQTAPAAGKALSVLDSNGAEVYSFTPIVSANSIIVSFPGMVEGETYTVVSDGVELGTATASLETQGGFGGMGGGMAPGGMGAPGGAPGGF